MEEPRIKRRRATMVCTNCKKRKTKCDKGKPSCNNCIKSNVPHLCFYEAPAWATSQLQESLQQEPSKERKTTVFSSDGKYFSSFVDGNVSSSIADMVLPPQKTQESEASFLEAELDLLLRELKKLEGPTFKGKLSDPDSSIGINFYQSYDSMTRKKSFVNDMKPFSEGALVFKDSFIKKALLLVMLKHRSKNEMPDVSDKYKGFSRKVINKVLRFDPKIGPQLLDLGKNGTLDVKLKEDLLHRINLFVEDRAKSVQFKQSFFPALFSEGGNSEEREKLTKQIEEILPPVAVYDRYMKIFMENIYVFHPLAPVDFFDKIKNGPLSEMDYSTNRFKVHVKDWTDLVSLATNLVMLRLSYTAFKMDPTKSEADEQLMTSFPMSIDMLTLAGKCLGNANIFAHMNENVLMCLLYIRIYTSFCPEETDLTSSSSTDILLSIIVNCALHMGLYKDPSDHIQFKDHPEKARFRQRLWLIVVMMTRVDVVIHGRLPLLPREYFIDIKPEKAAIGDEIRIKHLVHRLHAFTLMSEMDVLSSRVHSTTKLDDIRFMLNTTEAFCENHFPVERLKENTRNIPITDSNMTILKIYIMHLMCVSTVSSSLMVHFEYSEETRSPKLFKEFLFETMRRSMKMVTTTINVLDGTYDKYIDRKYAFSVLKITQYTFTKGSLMMISCLLRCIHTCYMLRQRKERSSGYPSVVAEMEEKIQTLHQISTQLLAIIDHLNSLAREKLAPNYYSSMRMITMFELVSKLVRQHGISFFKVFFDEMGRDSEEVLVFKKLIRSSTGYDLDIKTIQCLNEKNQMVYFSISDMSALSALIKKCRVPDKPFDIDGVCGQVEVRAESNEFMEFADIDWLDPIFGDISPEKLQESFPELW